MRCHAKVVVTSINVFFSIVFLVHISSIGYHTLYPEVPEIVVSKKNLNEIDFPITFRICAYDLKDTVSRYKSFGYAHYGDYFRGRSMFNDTVYGWAGHAQNGSVLGNVEGKMFNCSMIFVKKIDSIYIDVLNGVSFNWTEIVYKIVIYTNKGKLHFVNSEDITWNKIPQYPACQILDVIEYFMEKKDETYLQLIIIMNQVADVGVSLFVVEKNKVTSRHLKTNMLSYDGPSFRYDNLFVPHYKKAIISFRQNIYSEKEENKKCKNYPFKNFISFGDCDKKYLNEKFVNSYKIMPFWAALNLSEVTNHRLIFNALN